ncbi:MAG: cob(I)yrinic acid a,c-diamide adenosyltransferase [Synechococcaceae cyanobacterium SM2_3_2]|nr:cob(I)yrinic acid a,c-diamide adenosyltransferase [Synechococcaceae cyanobacterium SM2_3_2]
MTQILSDPAAPNPSEGSPIDPDQQHRLKMQRRQQVQQERLAAMQDHKGLILVNTGHGKGKSSAGFGVIFRALGHGMKVGIVQFIKGAWDPGEAKLLRQMQSTSAEWADLIEFHAMGEGFTWETQDRQRDIDHAEAAWTQSLILINSGSFQVVLLDEINVALKLGYLAAENILLGLESKPPMTHVILTGRGAPPELLERADLVTEMTLVKHPFREQGIKAQQGIEY